MGDNARVADTAADTARRIGIKLAALAQDGLTFAAGDYDLDRYRQVSQLAAGLALFAPGLPGYGLGACLSRVLLAAGRARAAAVCVGGGWLVVIAADIVLVSLAPGPSAVAMLALGNTIGLTAAGLALLIAVRRVRGPAALTGAGRAAISGLAAAAAGAGAGAAIAAAFPSAGTAAEGLIAALAGLAALAAFAGVALVLDGGELRAAAVRVWRVVPR